MDLQNHNHTDKGSIRANGAWRIFPPRSRFATVTRLRLSAGIREWGRLGRFVQTIGSRLLPLRRILLRYDPLLMQFLVPFLSENGTDRPIHSRRPGGPIEQISAGRTPGPAAARRANQEGVMGVVHEEPQPGFITKRLPFLADVSRDTTPRFPPLVPALRKQTSAFPARPGLEIADTETGKKRATGPSSFTSGVDARETETAGARPGQEAAPGFPTVVFHGQAMNFPRSSGSRAGKEESGAPEIILAAGTGFSISPQRLSAPAASDDSGAPLSGKAGRDDARQRRNTVALANDLTHLHPFDGTEGRTSGNKGLTPDEPRPNGGVMPRPVPFGSTLPIQARVKLVNFFPRLDLSTVRIHTGVPADRVARSMRADAVTVGRNILFRSGKFEPSLSAGLSLLAHELTHVGQMEQRNRGLMTVPDSDLEAAALGNERRAAGIVRHPLYGPGTVSREPQGIWNDAPLLEYAASQAAGPLRAPSGQGTAMQPPQAPSPLPLAAASVPLKADENRTVSHGAGTAEGTDAGAAAGDELDAISRRLYRSLGRQIAIERERRGVDRWVP